jgi:hypothetical protein
VFQEQHLLIVGWAVAQLYLDMGHYVICPNSIISADLFHRNKPVFPLFRNNTKKNKGLRSLTLIQRDIQTKLKIKGGCKLRPNNLSKKERFGDCLHFGIQGLGLIFMGTRLLMKAIQN